MSCVQHVAFCTTGSINNSASPVASALSRSRPVTRQISLTALAVRRLFAARGSFAFDLGALSVITDRPANESSLSED